MALKEWPGGGNMKVTKEFLEQLKGECGASNCAWIQVKDIVLDPGLRKNCELNSVSYTHLTLPTKLEV